MAFQKKRTVISVETKLKMISACDNEHKKLTHVAKEFGASKSTLSTILKQKGELKKCSGHNLKKKTLKRGIYEDLEMAVCNWYKMKRKIHLPIDGPMLRQKAETVALQMGIEDFLASDGWLSKFKKRFHIVSVKMCGEQGQVNLTVIDKWREEDNSYEDCDIYNFDELGLFCCALPDTTLAEKGTVVHGRKKKKPRVILGCVVTRQQHIS